MRLADERAQVVAYARRMRADRLAVGTSGNLSLRVGARLAVTPTGVEYDRLTPAMVGVHRLDGGPEDAPLAPTSELPMHLTAYRVVPEAGAVVHTHSAAATALSTLVDELPPIHYLVAMFGGPVRVAAYATYGTEELAARVAAALEGRSAAILGNHGALTVGRTLAEAYGRALCLEWLSDVYLRARSLGEPRLLGTEEIERVRQKLATYGQPPGE